MVFKDEIQYGDFGILVKKIDQSDKMLIYTKPSLPKHLQKQIIKPSSKNLIYRVRPTKAS